MTSAICEGIGYHTIIKSKGLKKAFIASDPDLVKFGVTKKITDLLDANEDITLSEVGKVIADATEDFVPPTVMKELKDFFATSLGHIIGRVIIIAVILLAAIIVTQIINRPFFQGRQPAQKRKKS